MLFLPWFEIQNGLEKGAGGAGPINETPHGLTSVGSIILANPDRSETRLVCVNGSAAAADSVPAQSAPRVKETAATDVNKVAIYP